MGAPHTTTSSSEWVFLSRAATTPDSKLSANFDGGNGLALKPKLSGVISFWLKKTLLEMKKVKIRKIEREQRSNSLLTFYLFPYNFPS